MPYRAELKIVKLISQNKTSQDIADELSISVRTVDKHRSNIIHKLKLDIKLPPFLFGLLKIRIFCNTDH